MKQKEIKENKRRTRAKIAIVRILCILGTRAPIDFIPTRARNKITILITSFNCIHCALCSEQPVHKNGPIDCIDFDISSESALLVSENIFKQERIPNLLRPNDSRIVKMHRRESTI